MDKPIILKVQNLKKKYKLGLIGGGSLQADLISAWSKLRNKEDPNTQIGSEQVSSGSFFALKGISFEVREGDRLGIIGGNGAGKSTTLKILSHVTSPTEGEVYLNGRISSLLEVGTGFHPELTGRENIYLNGAILGMTKKEVSEKIEDIIDFSECRQFIDTPVKRYSSGMYVKLAFAVAAHLNSEILIMDEVLAVGDMKFQKKCLNKMKSLATDENRTILYVSHNMNTIKQLCNRCIVLDKGEIIFDGGVDQAISYYLGNKSDNRISYDFSEIERQHTTKPAIMLKNLVILKNNNTFFSRDNLEFRLVSKALEDTPSIEYRFEIYSVDGQVVGTIFSDSSYIVSEGKELELDLSFSLGIFAPGKYYAVALIFEKDEAGNELFHDRVEPALFFEVLEDDGQILWKNQYWGNIHFPPFNVLDCKIR